MRVPPDSRSGNPRLSRSRAYVRLLRTPQQNVWYGDLDPRSWRVAATQIRAQGLDAHDIRRAASIVRAARTGGRAYSSLPRSGTNWVYAMVSCGLSLSQGGTGAFTIEPNRSHAGDDEWVFEGTRFGWPIHPQALSLAVVADRDHPIGDPLFTYGHEPLTPGMVDYRRSRSLVTVRDPLAVARSLVRKVGLDGYAASPASMLHRVERVQRFFSIWEQRLADPATAARSLVLRYEDMRADPVGALVRIGDHWDLGVDEATWAVAVERCSWDAMAGIAADRPGTARISLERAEIPADLDTTIRTQLEGTGASFGYGTTIGSEA